MPCRSENLVVNKKSLDEVEGHFRTSKYMGNLQSSGELVIPPMSDDLIR